MPRGAWESVAIKQARCSAADAGCISCTWLYVHVNACLGTSNILQVNSIHLGNEDTAPAQVTVQACCFLARSSNATWCRVTLQLVHDVAVAMHICTRIAAAALFMPAFGGRSSQHAVC